jgi:hypothetical protein
MKKIILITSLLIIWSCWQVDENKIIDETNTNIDTFLQNKLWWNTENTNETLSYSGEIIENNINNDLSVEIIDLKNLNNNESSTQIKEIETDIVIEKNIDLTKPDLSQIDLSWLEKIELEINELNINNEELILEETTSEDIEELLDLLLESR